MHLSEEELYDYTPRSFKNKLKGWIKKRDVDFQNGWEQTRFLVHACIAPHSKTKIKPRKMMPFPWDGPLPAKNIATQEEIQEVLERYKHIKPKEMKKFNKTK